jgi:hypothetical protein
MPGYTVACTREAEDGLAQLWLVSSERLAVSSAANAIEQELRFDASSQGAAAPAIGCSAALSSVCGERG